MSALFHDIGEATVFTTNRRKGYIIPHLIYLTGFWDNDAMSAWLPGVDEEITKGTFGRFITYFLHPDQWPPQYDLLQDPDDEMTIHTVTVKDVLPGFSQYSKF